MRGLQIRHFFCAQGVFALVFFYSLFAGLLIQLVLLPFAMPELDAGHGLLKGGDWVGFQQEAALLANRIRHEGWVIWELRPQGNAPIGVAAAVYALTGISEPWVLMPLNAGLFAMGATCLYAMFALIAPHRLAFIATMPYVFFPSAAMIFGQIHKDVWSGAGIALLVLVWTRFAACNMQRWKDAGLQAMLALTGILLVWLVRPYMVQIMLAASLLAVFVFLGAALKRSDNSRRSVHWWTGVVVSIIFLGVFAEPVPGPGVVEMAVVEETERGERDGHSLGTGAPGAIVSTEVRPAEAVISTEVRPAEAVISTEVESSDRAWRPESIAAFANKLFSKFATTRRGFTDGYPHAGSNIDTEVQFHSVADVVSYIPRALQIALFAPFPDQWGESGVSPGAGYMRLLAGIEMAFTYLVLPGIVLAFMRGGLHGRTTVLLMLTVVPIIVLALIVSNVGTLYRMRYANLQILNGLGVIGWMMWLRYWHTRNWRIAG